MTSSGADGPPVAPRLAGGLLTIDLNALAGNWAKLAEIAAPAECAAVVKGDGYGIGLEQATEALGRAGCSTFFVALPEEGFRARRVLPEATVYVLDGLLPGCAGDYAAAGLRPVLGSRPEIEEWSAFCGKRAERLPAAIHVDTGINRLGLEEAEFDALTARPGAFDDFHPALLMSHLACADTPDHPLNAEQLARFKAVRAKLPDVPASLANSAATLALPDSRLDLVRPGVALYGGAALTDRPNPMRAVVQMGARIVQMRSARAGETVGYGAVETLKRDSRLAIVAVGYADGFHRAAGSSDDRPGGRGVIDGHSLPIVGRISMDLIALDATDLPDGVATRGGLVELIGHTISVDEVAANAGTIGYEILTGLGRRFHREYRQAVASY